MELVKALKDSLILESAYPSLDLKVEDCQLIYDGEKISLVTEHPENKEFPYNPLNRDCNKLWIARTYAYDATNKNYIKSYWKKRFSEPLLMNDELLKELFLWRHDTPANHFVVGGYRNPNANSHWTHIFQCYCETI